MSNQSNLAVENLKYDLYGVAFALDSVKYIIDEVVEDYFEQYDADRNKAAILLEFNRQCAKMNAVQYLLFSMEQDLAAAGIVRTHGVPDHKEAVQHEAQ